MPKDDANIDVWSHGFMFALQAIDPSIGKLTVTYETRGSVLGRSTEVIEMVDCEELWPGGQFAD